jgi:hypothetical protein
LIIVYLLALPKRQPIVKSQQTKLRNQESLVAVGETNIFVLNELKQKWEVVSQAPLDENYRKLFIDFI